MPTVPLRAIALLTALAALSLLAVCSCVRKPGTASTPKVAAWQKPDLPRGKIVMAGAPAKNDEVAVMAYPPQTDGQGVEVVGVLSSPDADDWGPIWTSEPGSLVYLAIPKDENMGPALVRVDLADGAHDVIWTGERRDLADLSPDGTKVAYQHQSDIWVADLETGQATQLTKRERDNPNGMGWCSGAWPTWSPGGTRLAFVGDYAGKTGLLIMNADGTDLHMLHDEGPIDLPTPQQEERIAWSPDGTRLCYSVPNGLFVVNADGSGHAKLLSPPDVWDTHPCWSPDGSTIAFTSRVVGVPQIWTMKPDGTDRRQLTRDPGGNRQPAWSADGKRMAFVTGRGSSVDLYTTEIGGQTLRAITSDGFDDASPSWSPDGTRIAYTSERSGIPQVYVMNEDGSGAKQVTNETYGAVSPRWSPTRDEIVYVQQLKNDFPRTSGDLIWEYQAPWITRLAIVNADGSGLRVLDPGALCQKTPDWSPDGERICFSQLTEPAGTALYVTSRDGTSCAQITRTDDANAVYSDVAPRWSSDGALILFEHCPPNERVDVCTVTPEGENVTTLSGIDTVIPLSWGPLPGWVAERQDEQTPPGLRMVNPETEAQMTIGPPLEGLLEWDLCVEK